MHQTAAFLLVLGCAGVILLATCSAGVELLEVHGPDGQTVYLNAAEISSLRSPTPSDLRRYFAKGAHCIVVTTNSRFVAVTEACAEIRDRLK